MNVSKLFSIFCAKLTFLLLSMHKITPDIRDHATRYCSTLTCLLNKGRAVIMLHHPLLLKNVVFSSWLKEHIISILLSPLVRRSKSSDTFVNELISLDSKQTVKDRTPKQYAQPQEKQ